MLSPVLLIGVGGSGGKTLRALRQTLLRRLRQTKAGWDGDLPAAWQMLWLDTVTTQTSGGFPAPLLPNHQYCGLVGRGVSYPAMISSLQMGIPPAHRLDSLGGWARQDAAITIENGAGQYRSIGRTIAVERLKAINTAIDAAYKKMTVPSAESELRRAADQLGMASDSATPAPLAFVISSVSGGTGAGMFLDVAEALKSVDASLGGRTQVILYGPDIFSGLGSGVTEGVAPNALGAMAEVMAGTWTERMSNGSEQIFRSAGLTGRGAYGFGGRYTYLIGSSNGKVQIGEQHDMYEAVGDALSAIVADGRVQNNLVEHILTNCFDASADPGNIKDKTRLRLLDHPRHIQPLSSLGFGRVTLGMDRFVEYGSETVARSVIERLLWPHFETMDPNDPTKRERPMVDKAVADHWLDFMEASGLNERNPANDVVDAIRPPDEETRLFGFAGKVLTNAQSGMGAAGVGPDEWLQRILTAYNTEIQSALTDAGAERFKLVQTWTAKIQQQILDAVALFAARDGLQVVKGLLVRLQDEVNFVATEELPAEVSTLLRRKDELQAILNRTVQVGMASIPGNHPTIDQARNVVKLGAQFLFDADRYELAATLLKDINENILSPLVKAVDSAHVTLMNNAVTAPKTADGRPNPFEGYPHLSNGIVPPRLQPGKTEHLLIDTSQYASLLKTLVQQSIPAGASLSWESTLVERAVRRVPLDERGDKAASKLFTVEKTWVPKEKLARSTSTGEQQLAVSVLTTPEEIVNAIRKNIFEDHEIALGKFQSQGLNEYLSPLSAGDQQSRRDRFLEALGSAVDVSAPFALYDQDLMPVVHPDYERSTSRVVSAIPFASGTDLFDITKQKFAALGIWDEVLSPQWFGTTEAAQIDFFQIPTKAVNPMVFTSLTKPIRDSWAAKSSDPGSRAGFWNYRRARPLGEAVPAAQEVQQLMCDGWFAALFLNQVKREYTLEGFGKQISVWSAEAKGYVSFPYPLLSLDRQAPTYEDFPAVLESLSLSIIQAGQTSLEEALGGYWRLRDLGERLNEVMSNWVISGQVENNAPTPLAENAGSATDDWQVRQQALSEQMKMTSDAYQAIFTKVAERDDAFDVPKVYEIRGMIEKSLKNLRAAIDSADGAPKGLM